jgi:hypothetical protein
MLGIIGAIVAMLAQVHDEPRASFPVRVPQALMAAETVVSLNVQALRHCSSNN